MVTRAYLVYQCGIANVFAVDRLVLTPAKRNARLLFQGDFYGARMLATGLGHAGAVVRTAACNMAGDIAGQEWTDDLGDQPFSASLIRITSN